MPLMTYVDIMKKISDYLSFLPPDVACVVLLGPRNDKSKVGMMSNGLEATEVAEMMQTAQKGLVRGEIKHL